MSRGVARIACLAVATWALMFAPGAVIEDVRSAGSSVTGDQVAGAVLAPTFGAESFVDGRPCRMGGGDGFVCQASAALPVATVVVAATGLAMVLRRASVVQVSLAAVGPQSSRAPPRV